jgi:DNA-binding transcriptional LysR family regulator
MSSELAFFSLLVQQGSLARAARELGLTGPAVSHRLAQLEQRLGVRLLTRTTRRMSLTPEGELYLAESRRILGEIEALEQTLTRTRAEPRGLLRIHATYGFGRRQLAPAVSEFVRQYPAVDIQLTLGDQAVMPGDQSFDIAIRFGEPPEARVVARKIASNQRYLFASPDYLGRRGQPLDPDDLASHDCIVIREGSGAFGTWTLCAGKQCRNVKVSSKLSTNHGEVAVDWALDGHGILLRSLWDTAAELRAGRLVRVLPEWSGSPADIYALYPQRLNLSAKVRVFLDFLTERFAAYRSATDSNAELPW